MVVPKKRDLERTNQLFDDIGAGQLIPFDTVTRELEDCRYRVQETPVTREIVNEDEARIALLMAQLQYRPGISLVLLNVTIVATCVGLIGLMLWLIL
jgi:hypothetical protein